MIAGVYNLIRKRTHFFHRLEAAETMRAYVVHNMNENEDLLASLETTKSESAVTQKLAKEGVGLLRKAKEKKEASQAEAYQLNEEKTVMADDKKKVEEEAARLRQELQDLQAGFAVQKVDY